MTRVRRILLFLTEYDTLTRLEHRIFNSMCLIAIVILALSVPFSYYIGLHTTTLITMAMLVALGIVYYLARFRRIHNVAIIMVSVSVPGMLALNFFFSGGVTGTTLPALILTLFLIMIVINKNLSVLLALLCLVTGMGVITSEYLSPGLISNTYTGRQSFYFDAAYTYTMGVIIVFLGIYNLKQAYYREKRTAELKAAELEMRNQERTKLFSVVSHDLRAPLASIKGYMDLLKVTQLETNERVLLENKLADSVGNTLQMLDNLLSWSKSQLIKTEPVMRNHAIEEVLQPILVMQQARAEEKGILFSVELIDKSTIFCDADMLQLVVRNLLGNAIKFTDEGGQVKFKARAIGSTWLISVSDNGTGISKKNAANIFSLKSQSTLGTASEKGMGLGLYLSQEYTVLQNGKIWFENNQDGGTTFYLSFADKAPEKEITRKKRTRALRQNI